MRAAEELLFTQLLRFASLPLPGEAAPASVPATADERLRLVMGQDYPALGDGQQWRMSNNALYYAVQALGQALVLLQAQQAVVVGELIHRFEGLEPRLALSEANVTAMLLQLQATAALATKAGADAQAAASAAAAADAHALAAQAKVDSAAAALGLVQPKADSTAAALALVQAQQGKDGAALAAAQQRLTAAEASVTTAQAKADVADTHAQAAQAAASKAQAKADADETAAATAQATANTALATAQAAQNTQALLAARWRTARVSIPAIAIGATASLTITWAPAFADANYTVVAECEGTALLGLEATVTARAAATCTVQVKNSLGLAIIAGAGSVALLATHD